MINSKIITIRNIISYDVNAFQGDIIVGAPSITAYMGLAQRIEYFINKEMDMSRPFKIKGICPVIHEFCINNGHVKILADREGKFQNESPILDVATGSLKCTLILFVSYKAEYEEHLFKAINDIVMTSRIAGGVIASFGKNKNRQIDMYDNDSFEMAIKHIQKGYILKDRIDILEQSDDYIDTLINVCSRQKDKKNVGWLVPIMIGYKRISPCAYRTGSRKHNKKHMYVENVYSIGEYISKYKATKDALKGCIWNHISEIDFSGCRSVLIE